MTDELLMTAETTDVDATLITLLRAYESAFNANDARGMNALFAEDCVFVNFGGMIVRGKSALHAAQAEVFDPGGVLTSISVRYEPEEITPLSETIAVIHARQRTAAPPGQRVDEPDPMESVLTLTAQRSGGGWAIRLGQNTPVQR